MNKEKLKPILVGIIAGILIGYVDKSVITGLVAFAAFFSFEYITNLYE